MGTSSHLCVQTRTFVCACVCACVPAPAHARTHFVVEFVSSFALVVQVFGYSHSHRRTYGQILEEFFLPYEFSVLLRLGVYFEIKSRSLSNRRL